MNIVLVVADDPALHQAVRATLPETDLVLGEPTVEAALRRLIAINADALIVDDAPRLGRAAVERLHAALPDTPIVVLASRGGEETRASFTLAGARTCVPKPFSCDTLREAVAGLVAPAPPLRRDSAASNGSVAASSTLSQHQTALRWLSRITGDIQDLARLSQDLVDAMTDIFGAVRGAVLLESEGVVRATAAHGIPETVVESARLGFTSGLMPWFEAHACLFDRTVNVDAPAAVKELQVLGAALGFPLLCGGRVVGALLLGDKASGVAYTHEERELIAVVARCATTALENARLYADLVQHEHRLDTILASVTTGVLVVSTEKAVVLMNRSAEQILRVNASEVLGRSVQKLGSGFADVVLRALAEQKPFLRQVVQDAAIDATVGLSVTPLNGQGAVVVFSALPEEEVSSNELAYSPFWEYFAARVGQEVKNPMVAINTFAQLLPRKYDAPDFRNAFAEVVQKEVARINRVVETLFEFARHPRMALKEAGLNETVKEVLDSFEKALQERSIEIEADWAGDELKVAVDPAQFAQALHNVVQNSVDAMPTGGRLKIATRERDDKCEVLVSDSGPGVAEQDAPLMFMPFFSTKEQGMGLGLTVANRILRRHNGNLKLVRDVGAGATFSLELPLVGTSHADHSRC